MKKVFFKKTNLIYLFLIIINIIAIYRIFTLEDIEYKKFKFDKNDLIIKDLTKTYKLNEEFVIDIEDSKSIDWDIEDEEIVELVKCEKNKCYFKTKSLGLTNITAYKDHTLNYDKIYIDVKESSYIYKYETKEGYTYYTSVESENKEIDRYECREINCSLLSNSKDYLLIKDKDIFLYDMISRKKLSYNYDFKEEEYYRLNVIDNKLEGFIINNNRFFSTNANKVTLDVSNEKSKKEEMTTYDNFNSQLLFVYSFGIDSEVKTKIYNKNTGNLIKEFNYSIIKIGKEKINNKEFIKICGDSITNEANLCYFYDLNYNLLKGNLDSASIIDNKLYYIENKKSIIITDENFKKLDQITNVGEIQFINNKYFLSKLNKTYTIYSMDLKKIHEFKTDEDFLYTVQFEEGFHYYLKKDGKSIHYTFNTITGILKEGE